MNVAPLLEISELKKHFPIETGLFRKVAGSVRAVDGVSLVVRRGETLGLVGESGCGKTTLGRCIVRILDPTSGRILFRPDGGEAVDLAQLTQREIRPLRRNVQMIFQDPYSSLDPRMTVLDIIGEPLLENGIARGSALEDRVCELVEVVGLSIQHLKRYPHAFSGGQRQRIGIARALATHPLLVVADEAVSALDVSVQAQILNLLLDLQKRFGLTYLFIAHDLSVVKHVSDRVAVMYIGKLVEEASTRELYADPYHPYTEALMSAIPDPDPTRRASRVVLGGEPANPSHPPSGCYFHPRCQYAKDVCRVEEPPLRPVGEDHKAACHFAGKLALKGAGIT